MITGTVPPLTPAIWDTTVDYDEVLGDFYARDEIDHRVFIGRHQAIWVNTDTGERRVHRKNWKP